MRPYHVKVLFRIRHRYIGGDFLAKKVKMKLVLTLAILLLSCAASGQAPDPTLDATIERWKEINMMLDGDNRLDSENWLEEILDGAADGKVEQTETDTGWRAASSPDITIPVDPETLDPPRGERKPGGDTFEWGEKERILYSWKHICRMVDFFLVLCGGEGAALAECMKQDILISSLIHELSHILDDEGLTPEDTPKFEKDAFCKELDWWCKLVETDPNYNGGPKSCVGQKFKFFLHSYKDWYCVLSAL